MKSLLLFLALTIVVLASGFQAFATLARAEQLNRPEFGAITILESGTFQFLSPRRRGPQHFPGEVAGRGWPPDIAQNRPSTGATLLPLESWKRAGTNLQRSRQFRRCYTAFGSARSRRAVPAFNSKATFSSGTS